MATGQGSGTGHPATSQRRAAAGQPRLVALSLRSLPPELDEGPAFTGDPVLGWTNAAEDGAAGPGAPDGGPG